MTEPVILAVVAGAFTLAGTVAAGFFAIWKLVIETRKNTVAATAAVTATQATHLSLQDAAVKLDQVHALLTSEPDQAALKSEIALLRASVAVALSANRGE